MLGVCGWLWATTATQGASPVQVSVGEAVMLKAANVTKLAIADETIADVVPLWETGISVIGKKPVWPRSRLSTVTAAPLTITG